MASRLVIAIAFVAVCGIEANAQRTYVDAQVIGGGRRGGPNTRPIEAFLPGSNNGADDDLWSTQNDGSNSSVYQSGDGNGEDSPQIETTLTSLNPNALYSIYVHFWDAGTPWSIRAGLASGSLPLYASPSDAVAIGAQPSVLASSLSYSASPTLFAEADRTMYAGWLGTAKANSSGEITVYIDDRPSTSGLDERTWYDGVSFQFTTLQTLTLRVNTSTGSLSIRNDAGAPVDMNYYEIRSATEALSLSAWNSLNDQDGDDQLGAGWDEAGASSAAILSEVNIAGAMHFDPQDAASLGNAFIQDATQDLAFYYGVVGQSMLTPGYVEYVTSASLGDYNGNDHVDAADYTVWRNSLGAMGADLPADGDGDEDVDHDDYIYWKTRYGQPTGAGESATTDATVPEPACLSFSLAATAILSLSRSVRRRRAVVHR
jgi:hypothetical protein